MGRPHSRWSAWIPSDRSWVLDLVVSVERTPGVDIAKEPRLKGGEQLIDPVGDRQFGLEVEPLSHLCKADPVVSRVTAVLLKAYRRVRQPES